MKKIRVTSLPIKLGQFLKLANAAQDGLEAKIMISTGIVSVNGVKESQRGRKLNHGDIVEIVGDAAYNVVYNNE